MKTRRTMPLLGVLIGLAVQPTRGPGLGSESPVRPETAFGALSPPPERCLHLTKPAQAMELTHLNAS